MKRTILIVSVLIALLFCFCGSFKALAETSAPAIAEGSETASQSIAEDASDAKETVKTAVSAKYPGKGVDSFVNYSLPIMIYGMLGIFIVLGLIAISIYILGKIPSKEEKTK